MTQSDLPIINLPDSAGPSSVPVSRSTSPGPTLRRPASHDRLAKLMLPGRSRSSSAASQEASRVTAYAEDDIPTSGRTTPEQRRRTGKAAATSLLASDAKYRKFASMVDKSLQVFESVNEWADFISFLSRLLKTLQTAHPPYNEIPRKLIVSKRLAQCLNPALPSGVHQRALDVYTYIFSTIGPEGLRRDLLIWSSGLFPFFQYAATSVRPLLIKIYETYYLPLGEDLRPAAKALILALLPGMEEETGDFFDKVLSLLNRVSDAVSPSFFLSNMFLAMISNPSSRLAALNYLARQLAHPSEGRSMDVGLTIRGVAAVLDDQNVLVRRNGLDLLLRLLKLDGDLYQSAERTDQELLMRAACSIVLQREVSLSRRVYTWLLGTEDSPEKQMSYFRTFGLDMLASTLEVDMQSITSESDPQRPFKIFLSLLDKWEIGSALSERLVIPALRAVQTGLPKLTTMRVEMLDTATAVYEAVEPIIIWRFFFGSVQKPLDVGSKDLDLLVWLLKSIRQQDEEVVSIHIPTMLQSLLRNMLSNSQSSTTRQHASMLAATLLPLVPPGNFAKTAPENPDGVTVTENAEALSQKLYSDPTVSLEDVRPTIAASVIPDIVSLTFTVCQHLLQTHLGETPSVLHVLDLVSTILEIEPPSIGDVQGRAWTGSVLKALPKATNFAVVDALVAAILKASRCQALDARINITGALHMTTILDSLFRYLRPDAAPYHVRAVELLWEYNQLAEIHTLESVISRQMIEKRTKTEAYEAFGVLWRHTDDAMLPGEIFHAPVLMILDALGSPDPVLRQVAEIWMRCHLKSYFRILDPLLSRLFAATSDLDAIRFYIDAIATLFRFGGVEFSRACSEAQLKSSSHPDILKKAENPSSTGTTYLCLLTDKLIELVQVDEPHDHTRFQLSLRLHSSALDLLQNLVDSGNLPSACVSLIKDRIVQKLRAVVRRHDPALQSNLLSLVHAAFAATNTTAPGSRKAKATSEKASEDGIDFETRLVQVIAEGVSSPRNRGVLRHWIDFVLKIAPHLQRRSDLLLSLCECFGDQLRRVMLQLRAVYSGSSTDDLAAGITDAEPVMLLDGLERVVTLALLAASPRRSEDSIRPQGEGGGSKILGLVSGVFTVEAPTSETAADTLQYLDDSMNALLLTWSITAAPNSHGSSAPSQAQIYSRTRERARTVLEKLFKQYPSAVIGSCVQVWAARSRDVDDAAIFDCIDTLTPSAQKVVEIISETVHSRQSRGSSAEYTGDPALMGFLEVYVTRLEAPIAVQIWSTMFAFARDVLASAGVPSARAQLFPVLKCLTIICRTVATTSALEDRRLRRDVQDVYLKVLDGVVSSASRLGEGAMWERDPSPSRQAQLDNEGEKAGILDKDLGVAKIQTFMADRVVPNLRSFLGDAEKVASAAQTISTGIVAPAFREQNVNSTVLRLLSQLAKLPSATKAWRIHVGDAFNDARFFRMRPEDALEWKLLVCALMDNDKERFGELLGRITAAPSANIFTNREHEMVTRSLNLRRLSFVLLSAERNHYLTQLPSIQEKLVDILRTDVVSPRVHSEVYLCLRVLMCRLSPQHLANFWPVILAELLRVFENTMDEPPPDQSEDLQLVLAACKFLDLLLVIQSEDFQIHQWMFVTDTTDAVYPPEDYMPEAIMDRLSEILSEHNHSTSKISCPPIMLNDNDDNETGTGTTLRRPHLTSVHTLSSLYQLQPFFARASIDTYEGVYGSRGVDWETVEDGLNAEIFESG